MNSRNKKEWKNIETNFESCRLKWSLTTDHDFRVS